KNLAVGREYHFKREVGGPPDITVQCRGPALSVKTQIADFHHVLAVPFKKPEKRKARKPQKRLYLAQSARRFDVLVRRRLRKEVNVKRFVSELDKLNSIDSIGRFDQAGPARQRGRQRQCGYILNIEVRLGGKFGHVLEG